MQTVKGTGNTADYQAMTYDGDGNVLTQTDFLVLGTTTLSASFTSNSYNLEDQLVQTVKGTGNTADYQAMTYDGDGNVLTQTDFLVSGTTTLSASYTSNSSISEEGHKLCFTVLNAKPLVVDTAPVLFWFTTRPASISKGLTTWI